MEAHDVRRVLELILEPEELSSLSEEDLELLSNPTTGFWTTGKMAVKDAALDTLANLLGVEEVE